MKFLFASDSFKGTLSSKRIAEILDASAKSIFPGCETVSMAVADGGEGTVDAIIHTLHGNRRTLEVHGPLMEIRESSYGEFEGDSAIIEMAMASGLPLVPEKLRDPMQTTTYGTGELILDALNRGYRKISIALGGSATNDGGMGAMRALGVKFYDEEGRELEGRGEDLCKAARFDLREIHPAVASSEFTLLCDVNNPLTGKDGATYTFGPQKGGSRETLDALEAGMIRYSHLLNDEFGYDVGAVPGSGAAGGLGAAFLAFLNADIKSGVDTVLDLLHFDEKLEGVDLVVTGEGQMDWQSAFGKAPTRIGARCKEK